MGMAAHNLRILLSYADPRKAAESKKKDFDPNFGEKVKETSKTLQEALKDIDNKNINTNTSTNANKNTNIDNAWHLFNDK